jgi:hypothetical protein
VKRNAKWLALIVIVITALAPSFSFAQEFYGGPTHLLSLSAQPTVYIGWLTPNKATTFSLGNSASNTFNIRSLEQTLNVQGVWTELLVPIKTSSPLGLILDFGYLFPSNKQSEETYNLTSGVAASRTWNTSSQLWNFSVAATYHIFPSVTTIVGFRYESFMTNYKDYENSVPNGLYFNPQALGGTDFTFSGYIPFFGAVIDTSPGYSTNLKAGVIGFPALPGSFVYGEVVTNSGSLNGDPESDDNNLPAAYWNGIRASNEFGSGYFMEAFAQVSTPISWWAEVGAFVKYSGVYGKATSEVNTTRAEAGKISNTDSPPNYLSIPQSYNNQADVTFQRSNWIFGGTISACF